MPDESVLEARFAKMGARVRLTVVPALRSVRDWNGRRIWRGAAANAPFRVDVRRDERGDEYFDLQRRSDVEVHVLDVRPNDRHLLLMARQFTQTGNKRREDKSKFLCGHDERAWFVAAVPESAHASNVQDAKDALKPKAVWDAMREHGVPSARRDQRRTAAFVRQGEWFFIPRPEFRMDVRLALRNEPIRRGAGKPHLCQYLYRAGGERVLVNSLHPNGLTLSEHRRLPARVRNTPGWKTMVRDAHVYVKGKVRHPDHATIMLQCWHEVAMNTETQAAAMRHVAFLD
jgi:hypothetical protein